MPPTSGDRECVTYAEGSTSVRLSLSGRRLAVESSDKKNVHRAGRVSGGLLNPSGGARNRPRNKSVLAQSENELNHNFAGGNEFCLSHFQKSFARVRRTLLRGPIPVARRGPRQRRLDFPITETDNAKLASTF